MQEEHYSRINSCTRRPIFNQIVSYLIIALETGVFCGFVQPNYSDSQIRLVLVIFYGIFLAALLFFGFMTSTIDPVDPVMVEFKNGERSNIISFLDNCLYCDNCRSYVLMTSRHCKICNRCVHVFDHHCIWINNCIGKDNYIPFFCMIVAAFSNLTIFSVSVVFLWIQGDWHNYIPSMVVSWITSFITIVFSLLVLGLILLHIFLIKNGMTTFEFIMQKKQADNHQITPSHQIFENVNKTDQNMNPGESKISQIENIAEQNQQNKTSEADFSKVAKGYVNKQLKQSRTTPVNQEEDSESNLNFFYQKHKSLKILIGQTVEVKPIKSGSQKSLVSSKPKRRGREKKKDIKIEALQIVATE